MNQISESLLLTIAQVSATLLGLLIVAAFLYVETGLQRLSKHNPEARAYLRSTTKAIVTLYGFVLAVAFSLVIVDSAWAGLVYALGGSYIVVVMAEWTVHSAPSGHWSMCTSCDLGWPGRCSSFPWLPPGLSTDGSLVWPH